MFSNHERARPHVGHAEAGQTIEVSRGRRWMQTLRKLPMTAPKRAVKVSAKALVVTGGRAFGVPRAAERVPTIATGAHGHPRSVRKVRRSDRLEFAEILRREGRS